MYIWGITKKYKTFSWTESFMGGHINIGKIITIFGDNAMHWVLEIRTKKYGVICIRFFTTRPNAHPLHIYFSPNGTPWACTYYFGKNKQESIRAKIRKLNFGHNFSTDKNREKLRALNEKFDWLFITESVLEKYKVTP
jgi:hypothetical protein